MSKVYFIVLIYVSKVLRHVLIWNNTETYIILCFIYV